MGMFGIGGPSKADKAEDSLNENIELSKKYAQMIYDLGHTNYGQNADYANQAQQNAEDFNQQTEQSVADYEKTREAQKTQYESDIAQVGGNPSANSSWSEGSSAYDSETALGTEKIQNKANRQEYRATQQGLGQAGGFTNQGYNNALRAGQTGMGSMQNAYNALASYYSGQSIANKGLLGGVIAGTSGAIASVV